MYCERLPDDSGYVIETWSEVAEHNHERAGGRDEHINFKSGKQSRVMIGILRIRRDTGSESSSVKKEGED
jgi:hypothetical protein